MARGLPRHCPMPSQATPRLAEPCRDKALTSPHWDRQRARPSRPEMEVTGRGDIPLGFVWVNNIIIIPHRHEWTMEMNGLIYTKYIYQSIQSIPIGQWTCPFSPFSPFILAIIIIVITKICHLSIYKLIMSTAYLDKEPHVF